MSPKWDIYLCSLSSGIISMHQHILSFLNIFFGYQTQVFIHARQIPYGPSMTFKHRPKYSLTGDKFSLIIKHLLLLIPVQSSQLFHKIPPSLSGHSHMWIWSLSLQNMLTPDVVYLGGPNLEGTMGALKDKDTGSQAWLERASPEQVRIPTL